MPRTRKFNGETYSLVFTTKFKRAAKATAKGNRLHGRKARVTETKRGYEVWVRG